MSLGSRTKRSEIYLSTRRTVEQIMIYPELPIFPLIKSIHGRKTLISARRLENFSCREAAVREQLRFLHNCLKHEVLPVSLRYRPPVNHPKAWDAVRLCWSANASYYDYRCAPPSR